MDALKNQYLNSLRELTFNSKPIITNLTIIAEENLSNAHVIVQAIEQQISNVSSLIEILFNFKIQFPI